MRRPSSPVERASCRQDRKYFDSGDYALSKAGVAPQNTVGTAIPNPEKFVFSTCSVTRHSSPTTLAFLMHRHLRIREVCLYHQQIVPVLREKVHSPSPKAIQGKTKNSTAPPTEKTKRHRIVLETKFIPLKLCLAVRYSRCRPDHICMWLDPMPYLVYFPSPVSRLPRSCLCSHRNTILLF